MSSMGVLDIKVPNTGREFNNTKPKNTMLRMTNGGGKSIAHLRIKRRVENKMCHK